MHIIQIEPLEVGVYNDHKADHITTPPQGWAMIPPDMVLPSTFPRLGADPVTAMVDYPYEVEVEKQNEETGETELVKETRHRSMLTVVEPMVEGTLPTPVEPEPTEQEIMRADIDFLLALAE